MNSLSKKPAGTIAAWKGFAEIAVLALIYFVTARLGQLVSILPGNITPVWIPSGIILAAVLIRGYRVWPGIFLGAFAGNVWAYFSSESLGTVFRCLLAGTANGIGDTLCAVGGAYLITRTTRGHDPFGRTTAAIKFIILGALLASGVSALFGVTALCLTGFVPWHQYGLSLTSWWVGDGVGVLLITPMLLAWRNGWRGCRFGLEEGVFFLLLFGGSIGSLQVIPDVSGLVILPLFLWAVSRFDRRIAFTAIFLEAVMLTVLTALDYGPFSAGNSNSSLVGFQIFMILMTVPMYVVYASVAESVEAKTQLLKINRELDGRVAERTRSLELATNGQMRAESALHASEVRLQKYFALPLHGVAVTSVEKGWIEVNDRVCSILGYSKNELVQTTWAELTHPEDLAADIEQFERVLSGQIDQYQLEKRFIRKDGEVVWTHLFVGCVRKSDGSLDYTIAMLADITERKRTERSLQATNRRFRAIFEESPFGVALIDSSSGKFHEVNSRYAEISGRTKEELVATTWMRLTHPDDIQADLDNMALLNAGKISRFNMNKRYLRPDGSCVWISLTVSPINAEDMTHPCHLAMIDDITDRKRTEERLREKEESYRTLADSGLALIWTSGLDKKCDYFNQPWLKFTGRTLDQELGDGWTEGVHPDDVARCFKIYTEAFERRESFSMDYRLRRHDGEFRWIQDVGTPRHDGRGVFLGYIGHCLDISERMREEEERERLKAQINQVRKMESVGQLAGGVAHDFNNLLMVIQGHISLLLKHMPPESSERNKIEEIRKAANRGAALTRQLLTFGRKQVTQVCRIQINEIVEEILKMIGQILGEDIRVIMECAPHLGLVMMDPGQIQQVLMNLVVNARDAMPRGGTLTIETANVRAPSETPVSFVDVPGGDYAMIVVRDTGLGMTPEVQSHLFEPFFTTKEKGKGTGLGLAVVYGIVKQAGGYIAVQSEAGKGTTFRILLPKVRETEASIKKTLESDKSPVGGTETILLVEDEEALRKVATEILRSAGYRVIHASGAEEALRFLRDPKIQIHLMLSDVVMPGMQGPDLAEKARLLRPELKVVLMSGYSEDKIMNQILLENMTFLAKPISDDHLLRKLREVLDGGGGG